VQGAARRRRRFLPASCSMTPPTSRVGPPRAGSLWEPEALRCELKREVPGPRPPAAEFRRPACLLDFTRFTVCEQDLCYIRSIKADSASKRLCAACFMCYYIQSYHTDRSYAKF
jgi:hypothetical protein